MQYTKHFETPSNALSFDKIKKNDRHKEHYFWKCRHRNIIKHI